MREDNFEEEELYEEYLYFEYKDKWELSKKQLKEQADEIKRLNNIINELGKEFEEELKNLNYSEDKIYAQGIHDTIITHKYKLQELKEEVGDMQ